MFSDDFGELFADAVSHIAYASGGRLFVVSNIGAIASLDAYTGTIAWLNIYRTDNQLGMAANMMANPMLMRAMAAAESGHDAELIDHRAVGLQSGDRPKRKALCVAER